MDSVTLMRQVIAETTRLVEGTKDDQLAASTPCTEWTARDLINHLTAGATMFAIAVEEGSIPDEKLGQLIGGDNLGRDFRGAWKTASERAVAAFDQPGALDTMVKLPFGEMPGGAALNVAVFDVTTHACDLAHATGQPAPDEALCTTALEVGHQVLAPPLREMGLFAAEQAAADGAPAADRLLAFAGRSI